MKPALFHRGRKPTGCHATIRDEGADTEFHADPLYRAPISGLAAAVNDTKFSALHLRIGNARSAIAPCLYGMQAALGKL